MFIAPFLSACATVGSMQTASTLGPGKIQLTVEPGALAMSSFQENEAIAVPAFNTGIRVGVHERLDLGLRVGVVGIEFSPKLLLMEPTSEDGVMVAIAPAASIARFGMYGEYQRWSNVQLPVLVGVPLGPHEVVIGPRVVRLNIFAHFDDYDDDLTLYTGGSSLGLALRLGSRFTLMPEVSATRAFRAQWNGAVTPSNGIWMSNASVGLLIGPDRSG